MPENAIKAKSFQFAMKIVEAGKTLMIERREYILSKQLIRSGTAIGALYREAEHGESRRDFIHKMAIAQKECNETLYWLELLEGSKYLTKEEIDGILPDAIELLKLVTSIIRSAKKRM